MVSLILKLTLSSNQAIFLNNANFLNFPKSYDKNLNILRTKSAFKIKQKTHFVVFKGLSMKQIISFWGEGKSPTLNEKLNKGSNTYDAHFEDWEVWG